MPVQKHQASNYKRSTSLLAAGLLIVVALISGCETTPTAVVPELPQACQTDPNSGACACAQDPASATCICSQSSGLDCRCARTPDALICSECPAGSARKLTRDAQLSIGQGNWARAELQARCALEATPGYVRAENIQIQLNRRRTGVGLNTDSVSTVPYVVQPGDRLGNIAQKCLGDPDKFVNIAVLNRIENPSRLRTGTTLRIPTTRPCVNCDDLREEALRSEARGELELAVQKLTRAKGLCRGNELISDDQLRLRDVLIKTLHAQAEQDLASGATDPAKAKWKKILELDKGDAKAQFYLDELKENQ